MILGILIVAILIVIIGNATNLIDLSSLQNRFLGGGTAAVTESSTDTEDTESEEETQSEGETQSAASEVDEVVVPDLKGYTREEAETALNERGLTPQYGGEQASTTYQAGQVTSQSPAFGSSVARGTTVTYYISSGEGQVAVPDVAGTPSDEALAQISAAGLVAETVEYYVSTVPEGYVIYTNPQGGTLVDPGSTVTVNICRAENTTQTEAPVQTEAPAQTEPSTTGSTEAPTDSGNDGNTTPPTDYTGQSAATAISDLEGQGYRVIRSEQTSDTVPAGDIISQTVGEDGTITLVISAGPPDQPVTDPALDGGVSGDDGTQDDTDETKGTDDVDVEAVYACNSAIPEPDGYDGQPVRIELTQNGQTTTLVDGSSVSFPYILNERSSSGASGEVVLYILNSDTYDVEQTVEYDRVQFKRVES
ncbi:MAG TPA: PASTA domain-containing protein [Candidatus Limivivens intestinipullorum]|uniref:PASTA domain-containing protein n=1 Tax=Candidatus Limivivens intestinipullorum TaxID=2840858 RepID=A0A9D1EPZ0_9FIRM|nr:PASTA domain-containing protein [Candidatus Limivivens intestinipullorum]